MTELAFPAVLRPRVSILMVTFQGWSWVRRALESVIENTEPYYEMIIVDNASPDGVGSRLAEEVRNARIVRNAVNRGFGAASNQAAAYATGEALVFLNSDAFVQPGWLPPLLERLEEPSVAAVAPRLLNPDGSLQEAGSLLFRNGYTGLYGFGDSATRPEYRFPRVVDYASAACLLVRRQDFFEVGGFDAAYSPAYFEDVDLCLSLAARGARTVYEPRSVVTHIKGASGDQQTASEYWSRNLEVFAGKWGHRLASRPAYPRAEERRGAIAARDCVAATRLLLATDRLPESGSSPGSREAWLVAELAAAYPDTALTLLCPEKGPADWQEAILALGVEVAATDDAASWLEDRGFHYDVVVLAGSFVRGGLNESLRETQPQAYRVVDLGSAGARADTDVPQPGLRRADRDAGRLREIETLLAADLVLVSGFRDAARVRSISEGTPCVLLPSPFGAAGDPPGFAGRRNFLFLAASGAPGDSADAEALDALVEQVMPRVHAERPDVEVTAVVNVSPTQAARLERKGVRIVSARFEAKHLLESTKVVVAPFSRCPASSAFLQEAASAGAPFVVTREAAGCLPFEIVPPHALATDFADLAQKALALDREARRWLRLRNRLRRAFLRASDRAAGREAFVRAFAHVGLLAPRPPRAGLSEARR